MGNRFIEALSSRYKNLLGSSRAQQGGATGTSTDTAEHTAPAANPTWETAREAIADFQASINEREAHRHEPLSGWQLVAPGYQFEGGTLRVKNYTAVLDSVSNAAVVSNPSSTAGSTLLATPNAPVVDSSTEMKVSAPRHWVRHPLSFASLGLTTGCVLALVGFGLFGSDPPRQPLPVSTAAMAPVLPPAALEAAPVDPEPQESLPVPQESLPVPQETMASDDPMPNSEELEKDEIVVHARPMKPRPKARPRIELETQDVMVSGRAVAAVLVVKRTGSTRGPAWVRWKTVPGTATPAEDYESKATTVKFNDGQAMRTIFVPILQPPPGAEPRTFSVVLERTPRSSALGSVTSATVTIVGEG